MAEKKIRVAEMFAGVGGFHLGLKRASKDFDVVWADQFEPGRTKQFAFDIYKKNFPDTNVVNDDISTVDKSLIPDMNLLVGGFPCQDYSVATTQSKGIYGKKGVLWWDIIDVIEAKHPEFMLFENVDRLLKAPGANKREEETNRLLAGRDFGMILRTLADLDYGVTWKMINAADYGYPQRRRRTFIFVFRQDTNHKKLVEKLFANGEKSIRDYLNHESPFSKTMKNESLDNLQKIDLMQFDNLVDFTDNFSHKGGFLQTGVMVKGEVYMSNYSAKKVNPIPLKEIVDSDVKDEKLYLTPAQQEKFIELKAGFRTVKVSRTGHEYKYGMGGIAFPDPLNRPARTMVTSEHSISRMSHVIKDPGNGKLRVISPEEAERINTFPTHWTDIDGIIPSNRYFAMGNALVVDLVKEMSEAIHLIMQSETLNRIYKSDKHVIKVKH